jgi:hypothetical protein
MKPSQSTLPGVRDFAQPLAVRGSELAAVIAQARAAGYHAHRMTVLPEAVYELRFYRITEADTTQATPGSHLYAP